MTTAEHRDALGDALGDALEFLATGVDSFASYVRPDGELYDPVFGEPTQYGTAYHALGNAVLAVHGRPAGRRAEWAERAERCLVAALAHTADPTLPPAGSGFDSGTGAVSRSNHRDFTWPPILKAFRLLRDNGSIALEQVRRIGDRIAGVDVPAVFNARPPSNWSSVWLSGEWVRIREGLSPHTRDDIDEWLAAFFAERLDLDLGFYAEPGLPNSYDLFTRYHLADLVAEGYDGRWRADLDRLGVTGLARSRAVQLSDGSLASAHRSAGQTWTLGVQVAYFTLSGATDAADRAFASMRRWQRPGGPYSPVENALPASFRIGYEGYTADAHYANLALGFLAAAVDHGYTGAGDPGALATGVRTRPASARIENAPTWRAVLAAGPYSAAVNGAPAERYDAFGLTDLTCGGPERILQFASSVRHAQSGRLFNLGLDIDRPDRSGPLEPVGDAGVRLAATTASGDHYELTVRVEPNGVDVTERATDASVLFVPYLRDAGDGLLTTVQPTAAGVRLTRGDERVVITIDRQVSRCIVLEYGFANRRGLCGLARLELAPAATDPSDGLDTVTYRVECS